MLYSCTISAVFSEFQYFTMSYPTQPRKTCVADALFLCGSWACCYCSYVVIINGKKAIHEALITNSIDFADRPEPFRPWATYPPTKGIYDQLYTDDVALVRGVFRISSEGWAWSKAVWRWNSPSGGPGKGVSGSPEADALLCIKAWICVLCNTISIFY